tara:strand:+ start:424 stop:1770 length:1347 start_codon:yes stop_codon:yes gene_type:complete
MSSSVKSQALAPAIIFPVKEYPYEISSEFISLKRTPRVKELQDTVRKYGGNNGLTIKACRNNGTIAPREFQRPESWKAKDKKLFFLSLLMDRVEGVLVIVDVETALHKIEVIFPNDRAVQLFRQLLADGYKYVIMDGNNRLMFILSLINNEYQIPVGWYEYIVEGSESSVSKHHVRRGKQTFADLPDKMQEAIIGRSLIVSEYYQIDWVGLKNVFKNCNAGCPPNPQELRNAGQGAWPEYVRQISDNLTDMLPSIFADPRARLCGDDWIADCLDYVIQSKKEEEFEDEDTGEVETKCSYSSINQTSKNTLYGDGSTFLDYQEQKYYLDKFDELQYYFNEIKSEATELGFSDKMLKRRSTWQNLFWMLCNGIMSYEQAVAAVRLHETAWNDKNRFFGAEGEDFDDLTFKNSCEGSRAVNVEFRHIILSEIVGKVLAEFSLNITESLAEV